MMEDHILWKMTDEGRVIMGEVSLQKSFPYSGHMCLIFVQNMYQPSSMFVAGETVEDCTRP